MKIGIMPDTHDQIDNIKKAITIFKKEKVSLVYHLGDYCSPFTLYLYKDIPCSFWQQRWRYIQTYSKQAG